MTSIPFRRTTRKVLVLEIIAVVVYALFLHFAVWR